MLFLVVVGALAVALYALHLVHGQQVRLRTLEHQVERLRREADDRGAAGPEPEADAEAAGEPFVEQIAAEPEPEIASEPEPEPEPQPAFAAEAAPSDRPSAWAKLEEELTSRWLVWLGGLAIAIAGYFLAAYAIEQGLLGPKARIILGLIVGAALVAGGEYLRRRPAQLAIAAMRTDYVPQALTAGGLAMLFAAVYAAYGLYSLIGALVAFFLLGVIAIGAFALAVWHGWFVAVLGLLGGFATPALISTGSSNAFGLFMFLAVVAVACGAVMWYRRWEWLGFGSIAGGAIYTLLWLPGYYDPGDCIAIGGFWLAVFGVHAALAGDTNRDDEPALWQKFPPPHLPDTIAWTTALAIVVLIAAMGWFDGYTNLYVGVMAVLASVMVVAGVWRQRLDALTVFAGVLVVLSLSSWLFDEAIFATMREFAFANDPFWTRAPTGDTWRAFNWTGLIGVAWLAGLYVLMFRAKRPFVWAAMSIIVPVLLLVAAYNSLFSLLSERVWTLVAFAVAAAFMAPVSLLRQQGPPDDLRLPLGIYALGVVAAVSLGFVFLLEDAWLTVALALQIPAIAWIAERLDLQVLRRAALVIAVICIARLALNPALIDYSREGWFGAHWVIYAYGVPALAFHAGFVMFRRHADDLLISILEGGRLAFVVLLISAEIRVWVAGGLDAASLSLLEIGLHTCSWLVLGWSRWLAFARNARLIDLWGGYVLTGLGCVAAVLISLLIEGPLFNWVRVGPLPILNTLAVAYLVPAALVGLTMWQTRDLLNIHLRRALALICFVLGWAWLTFETRHAFQGSVMRPSAGDAESYAYSAVWLVASFALLFAAIFFRKAELRYASLVLIVISVLKVFMVDMADLQGLYRVASFLGLGLSLVGIGFIYQRFVFVGSPPDREEAKDSEEASPA